MPIDIANFANEGVESNQAQGSAVSGTSSVNQPSGLPATGATADTIPVPYFTPMNPLPGKDADTLFAPYGRDENAIWRDDWGILNTDSTTSGSPANTASRGFPANVNFIPGRSRPFFQVGSAKGGAEFFIDGGVPQDQFTLVGEFSSDPVQAVDVYNWGTNRNVCVINSGLTYGIVIGKPLGGTSFVANIQNSEANNGLGGTNKSVGPQVALTAPLSGLTCNQATSGVHLTAISGITQPAVGTQVCGRGIYPQTYVQSVGGVSGAWTVTLSVAPFLALTGATVNFSDCPLNVVAAATQTQNGTTASSTTVTAWAGTAIAPGMVITGAGIPAGTYVVAYSGGTITLSQAATASATVPLTVTDSNYPAQPTAFWSLIVDNSVSPATVTLMLGDKRKFQTKSDTTNVFPLPRPISSAIGKPGATAGMYIASQNVSPSYPNDAMVWATAPVCYRYARPFTGLPSSFVVPTNVQAPTLTLDVSTQGGAFPAALGGTVAWYTGYGGTEAQETNPVARNAQITLSAQMGMLWRREKELMQRAVPTLTTWRGTVTLAANSNQATAWSSIAGTPVNGDVIAGPGIPYGTTVLSGGGTATLTLSQNTQAAATASATMNGTTTVTAYAGTVAPTQGSAITGVNIAASTTIADVTGSSGNYTLTLSQAASGSGTNNVTITPAGTGISAAGGSMSIVYTDLDIAWDRSHAAYGGTPGTAAPANANGGVPKVHLHLGYTPSAFNNGGGFTLGKPNIPSFSDQQAYALFAKYWSLVVQHIQTRYPSLLALITWWNEPENNVNNWTPGTFAQCWSQAATTINADQIALGNSLRLGGVEGEFAFNIAGQTWHQEVFKRAQALGLPVPQVNVHNYSGDCAQMVEDVLGVTNMAASFGFTGANAPKVGNTEFDLELGGYTTSDQYALQWDRNMSTFAVTQAAFLHAALWELQNSASSAGKVNVGAYFRLGQELPSAWTSGGLGCNGVFSYNDKPRLLPAGAMLSQFWKHSGLNLSAVSSNWPGLKAFGSKNGNVITFTYSSLWLPGSKTVRPFQFQWINLASLPATYYWRMWRYDWRDVADARPIVIAQGTQANLPEGTNLTGCGIGTLQISPTPFTN